MKLLKKLLVCTISMATSLASLTLPTFATNQSGQQRLQSYINKNEPFIITGEFFKQNKKSLVSQEQSIVQYLNKLQSGSTFKIISTEEDLDDSQSIIRLQQYIHDIPVHGSDVVACVGYNGMLTSISGYIENIETLGEFNYNPKISELEAVSLAIKEFKIEESESKNIKSQLYIYNNKDKYSLAYKLDLQSSSQGLQNKTLFVDAYTKDIIVKYDNIDRIVQPKTVTSKGVLGDDKTINISYINGESGIENGYYFIDTTRGADYIKTFDCNNEYYESLDLSTTSVKKYNGILNKSDGKFVDAHYYIGKVYDFYSDKFSREGINNNGSKANVLVNIDMPGNAFFTKVNGRDILAFGNGDSNYNDSSAALDVIAHEYTHAIVNSTAKLFYSGQSGAIDEAYGDLFGTLIEHSYKSDKNWTIGEDMVKGGYIRDLINPTIDNVNEMKVCNINHNHQSYSCDFDYVHENSGVITKLGYLIAQSLGEDAMGKLFYNALTEGLYSQSDFKHLGSVLLTKASNDNERQVIKKALVEVGILDSMTSEVGIQIENIEGSNRYETSTKISKLGWEQSNNVVLVNSTSMVDALSATPFAKTKDAPILLTDKDNLNEVTKKEILRLKATKVYVIGGEKSISGNIISQLKFMGLEVERIAGENRYITSLIIAKRMESVSEVALVNGETGIADAVSIAPVAATKNMPILLVSPTNGANMLNDYIKNNNITRSYVIGEESSISKQIESNLPDPVRLGGNNRNETNAIVIDKFYKNNSINNIFLAKDGTYNKGDLIDALLIGVYASNQDSPIVIANKSLDSAQKKVLSTKKPYKITKIGGNGNERAFEELKKLFYY